MDNHMQREKKVRLIKEYVGKEFEENNYMFAFIEENENTARLRCMYSLACALECEGIAYNLCCDNKEMNRLDLKKLIIDRLYREIDELEGDIDVVEESECEGEIEVDLSEFFDVDRGAKPLAVEYLNDEMAQLYDEFFSSLFDSENDDDGDD